MTLKKTLGKLKFEMSLTRFQLIGVITWIMLLLVIPIAVDLYSKNKPVENESAVIRQDSPGNRVAGVITQDKSLFTYTVDFQDKKDLISTLTFIFGGISAVIAFISLIVLIRGDKNERTGVFAN